MGKVCGYNLKKAAILNMKSSYPQMTPLQKGCFATETTEFFEFFSHVFSVNSVAELVFAVDSQIAQI